MKRKIQDKKARTKINPMPKTKRINPKEVAKALGAEIVGKVRQDGETPLSFFALREQILSQLRSTGGRPSRSGTTHRRKVPMSEEEWSDLEEMTKLLERFGVKTSPGQVAGFLLENSIRQVKTGMQSIQPEVDRVLEAAASSQGPLGELSPVAEEMLRKMMAGIPGIESFLEK